MATINPSQDYDIIHTLTYASSGGTNGIQLHRGSSDRHTGTVYYRAGTSGSWTSLSVSGTTTTFPITSTTMQIAHNWNKSGNNYMTPNFQNGTMTGIAISQKAVLSGVMGTSFMLYYAYGCSRLTSLEVPDTSGLTSVGDFFMLNYAYNCSNLTTIDVPDTSGLTSVGGSFMYYYADSCSRLATLEVPDTSRLTSVGDWFMASYAGFCYYLTTLAVPDTSGLTSVGNYFMRSYATGCNSLTQLNLPKAGWFKTHNVNWSVPSGRLNILRGYVPDSADLADWQALTVPGKTLYTNYIRSANDVFDPFPTQPVAAFTANPTSGKRPVTVQFTDLTKGIPDTWSWNFGDGYTSSQQNPSHPYSKAGTYTVSLTASNSVGTDTVTKTGLVVIEPEIFTRSIGGTIKMGGGITSRIVTFMRSIGGTIKMGGGVRAVLVRDAEALQSKTFLYKVYNPDGTFVEAWRDVISEPSFTHEINSAGSTMTVELARNSDSLGQVVSPLLTEAGQPIQTEDGQTLLATTTTRNQIGDDSSVNYNNRVDIVVFYGRVEPLYTEDMQIILTEDGEPLLAGLGAPNGRRIFSGFISDINSRYGGTETTTVQLTSFGYDLAQYPVTTSATNDVTTVTYNSTDPSDIVRTAVDRFEERSNLEQVTYTHRESGSIATTGTLVSYTFRNNNYQELLDKSLELMPSNWYYRIGLGDNVVYFRERPTTPQHLFYLGKHIKALDLRGSILDVVNHTLFTGGGEPALYVQRKEAPAPRTRRGLEVRSDSRVTVPLSAQIISDGLIENGNKVQYRTTVEILSGQYDIESIQPGDLVGFRNFGVPEIDTLELIVVGVSYTPDIVQLSLERKPPTVSKRLEDIKRQLTVAESQNIPGSPS